VFVLYADPSAAAKEPAPACWTRSPRSRSPGAPRSSGFPLKPETAKAQRSMSDEASWAPARARPTRPLASPCGTGDRCRFRLGTPRVGA